MQHSGAFPPVLAPPPVLLEAREVTVALERPARTQALVLDRISLALRNNEILAIVGPSGCGKSTLLRVLAGLLPPTQGEVRYRGETVRGPHPGIAMVFQTFALFPWMTVLENVELGLRARGVPPAERQRRALEAIDLIGLDGFESAYPKELSGGMRQRVAFARSLVVQPDVLLMDEPFSALDALTAENLRTDLLELWLDRRIPTRAMALVTHNIEEAVFLSDRVVVLSTTPTRILGEVRPELPHWRDREAPEFQQKVHEVYALLAGDRQRRLVHARPLIPRLPMAPVGLITGLVELVHDAEGRVNLPELAGELQMDIEDLLPAVEAAELLGFLASQDGDLLLTEQGRALAEASVQDKKEVFREALLNRVRTAQELVAVLCHRRPPRMTAEFFLDLLERHFSAEEARRQLGVLVDWGRYAEAFAYDETTGEFYLEPDMVS
ncbi:MAG: nitrate/sulfonate/bicarbonate ABC transporter ATP-binding protein [Armatimonadota bacterium]|nr:nitrate/sulfonate/bicarbonate ABC transporter ATP-binding protein [Armatimonadota bacterium]MDR7598267.1 nitrate/sulfonate/bicarbonate ABC transporter ATP-binding protein [Armatimonadota bacterium]